jgi:hypothetical protein
MGLDRRGVVVQQCYRSNLKREDFCGQSETVLYREACCMGSIQAGEGKPRAAGVDGMSIADFEQDLANNLYLIWNRMSSGSYFPQAVRRVDIPKGEGRTRPLGISTVSDRIAQTVVQRYLEPILEPVFHKASYERGCQAKKLPCSPARGSCLACIQPDV